jgi:hypothetical protein
MRCAIRHFGHTVEVRHESRQVLQATPERVGGGERHFEPNRFADVHATISTECTPGVVGLGVAVRKSRPLPRDAAIEQRSGRRRHKRADGRSPGRANEQQQRACAKREPVFNVGQRRRAIGQSLSIHGGLREHFAYQGARLCSSQESLVSCEGFARIFFTSQKLCRPRLSKRRRARGLNLPCSIQGKSVAVQHD